ncbi:TPA: hypothetical protein DIT45_01960 [Candidatus Acetothermia bacterium]|nr:hypothetical protein [Candidatus Acetothermia bacterium]
MKVRIVLLAALVLVVGLGAGLVSAEGKTITVGPSGCDYTSIQEAIDAASPGDVIKVKTGTYQENLIIDKPLTLRGEGPDLVTIDRSPSAEVSQATLWVSNNVTVTGFTITNTDPDKQAIGIWISGDDVHIVANRIVDVWVGVEAFAGGDGVEIAHNEILRCQIVGIGVLAIGTIITENTISECNGGIALGFKPPEGLGGVASATIFKNTISRNRFGIVSYGAIANIFHNLIEENSGPGIATAYGPSSFTIMGNTIRKNGEEGIRLGPGDIAMLLQNTVAENKGNGILLAVEFAEVAGNRILANQGNGINVRSCGIAVIVGGGYDAGWVHANVIKDNEGYGLFAEDASMILACYSNEISGNEMGDFSENLKDQCQKAGGSE